MDEYLIRPLCDFVELFEKNDIPYALIGGVAISVQGVPRPTHDIDFTISLDRSQLPEMFFAAQQLGYSVSGDYASGWVDVVAGMPLVRVRQWIVGKSIDIDIFLAESEFQDSIISRRVCAEVEGISTWIASPEDLILLKIVAGRPRDLGDVADILLVQGQLDEEYMRRWAQSLGVLALLEQTLKDNTDAQS